MPRIREFKPEDALVKAMHVFWAKGYKNTSLSNLVKATGVAKKGLYTVFGSKHKLYIKAMEYYKCMQSEQLLSEIEDNIDAGLPEIRDLFRRALDFTQSELGSRGCLVCNAMAEFGENEPEIWRATTTHVDRFRHAIGNALHNSSEKGEINVSPWDIEKEANFLCSVLQSLMLMSRAGTSYKVMKDTVDISLYTLEK